MKFYLAPMEGITGYIYRNALYSCYNNIDKYFTPFIMPNQNRCFNTRELNDVLPEHNRGMYTVPQILTNSAEDFVKTALALQRMGYDEVNLNLGCPSRTVVTKMRGAGFLAEQQLLRKFLEQGLLQRGYFYKGRVPDIYGRVPPGGGSDAGQRDTDRPGPYRAYHQGYCFG